ncbi:adenylate/guanylate cyclase domain-containing protein [Geminicoccus roseus]|uniref:adenylate/guanylate cyclase domain-containing protein n=1 Tax=Geminicoccus roseus TaxID=404900 RepID=UPI0023E4234B|nr:adenylate/guanylate cyclase domain-containing protein [Geminicoccus roseus]
MPAVEAKRRLAVVWAADAAGYSRLMGEDEEATLATLASHQEVIGGLVAEHEGRIFSVAGDGIMAVFASPVMAVRAAVAVQRALGRRNADLPEPRRLVFRIGVTLGDVIARGEDLYGDSVNITARLQALAEPGQIYISVSVHEQIAGRLGFPCQFAGERAVKNIGRPVQVFRVDWSLQAPLPIGRLRGGDLPLPDKPSIAVLPFANISGDPDQDYFADGLTADLITALAKFRWFFVIAQGSSFGYRGRSVSIQQVAREMGVRYVLEGSTRRSGGTVRMTAQLVEALTGRHLWAERYDRDLADLFAVQDEIVAQVIGAIEPALLKAETARAHGMTPAHLTAWDLIFRGMWHFHQINRDDYQRAREHFRAAVEAAPALAESHTWLGRCCAGIILLGWSDHRAADIAEGWQAAQQATRLAEADPYAHYAVGIMSIAMGQAARAIASAQRAIDLSPNFALGFMLLGMARLRADRAHLAIEPLQRGLRLSPNDPHASIWLPFLAIANFVQGDFQEAAHWAADAVAKGRGCLLGQAVLACSLAALDRRDEAGEALAELQRSGGAATDDAARLLQGFAHPNIASHVLRALQDLGPRT